jgi:hypothetical protein
MDALLYQCWSPNVLSAGILSMELTGRTAGYIVEAMNIRHFISKKHLWLGFSPVAVVFPFS